ncbi:MAG TPA: NADAR family protein, partial [Puia sp.]|nr:NADAR family protein [Puia sp.]
MTYNKQWLIQKFPDAGVIPFLFFWGHQPSKDGSITKSCFSQWWVAPFEVEGVRYPTAEHWMMAGKAKLFGDEAALPK